VDLSRTGITSSGGRYQFKDELAVLRHADDDLRPTNDKMISWEGKCCNGMKIMGAADRGGLNPCGTTGTVLSIVTAMRFYDLRGTKRA